VSLTATVAGERNMQNGKDLGFRPSTGASCWPPASELHRRAARAREMLARCEVCELRCGVDRLAGQRARCGLGGASHLYKSYISLNEEPGLSPALRVFLGGCNFRCPWCDEAPQAFDDTGGVVNARTWAAELHAAVSAGVRCISVLGGEPTLHVHTLLALAAAAERPLPIALNTNLYMTPEVLDLLDGVATHWLADFKFGNDACARRFAGVPDYLRVVTRNLRRLGAASGLIVRHVLLPGHFDCCFRPVIAWLGTELPGTRFQLYPGYVPCGRAARDAQIGRLNTRAEVVAALAELAQRPLVTAAAPPEPVPSVAEAGGGHGELRVTIGADGRVYCHDLTPGLAAVLAEVCRPEPARSEVAS